MEPTLPSATMSVAAPMSFTGSLHRLRAALWSRRTTTFRRFVGWWALPVAVIAVWTLVAMWYLLWGFWLVPYRLLRRSQRTRKLHEQRHREVLAAIQQHAPGPAAAPPGRDGPAWSEPAGTLELPPLRGELPAPRLGPADGPRR